MAGRVEFEKGAKVKRWERNLDKPTKALKQIGALMVAESQRAFKAQTFDGKAWPPRSDVNVFGIIADFHAGKRAPPQRRFQTRPALRDTGRLAASITFNVIGNRAVEVGTNLPYAEVHQTGGEVESMPITERVQKSLWAWLKDKGPELKSRLGWLLNKKFRGTKLTMEVPARPFVGITKQLRKDVKQIIGVHILESRR